MRGDVEWFHYHRARLLSGTSAEIIRDQILAENILVDLRLHDKITSARNHGTGFRTFEDKLPLLFEHIEQLRIRPKITWTLCYLSLCGRIV